MGGQDKQGFAMKQGVLTNGRVRLLMTPGDQCFRGYGRRKGECFLWLCMVLVFHVVDVFGNSDSAGS